MKKVSLIIPIYNTQNYLRKCLDSAIGQTYKNMEIICVDDGSTDDSSNILDEYAKKDGRIIAIHQKNQGESGARNRGLEIASGDYIGFMDCDDWIEPEMYQILVEKLEICNADIAIGGWFCDKGETSEKIDNKKPVEKAVFGREKLLEYIYERDSYRAFAYMWDKLYARRLFYNEKGSILFNTDLKLGGDVLVLGRIALDVKRAVYVDKPFYHYIQRDDSGCHSQNIEKRKDWLKAYEILIKIFEQENIDINIVELVKRFLAYHSSNVAELAIIK